MNTTFFEKRYDASQAAGVTRVMNGDISLFPGVTEAMANEVIVAIMLRRYGQRFTALAADLKELESLGYEFFLVGIDFLPHVTVQVAVGGLESVSQLKEIGDQSEGRPIPFNRLVLDPGGNIVLMNEGVPQWVSSWRGYASQVMTEHGGQPKPLPILHATMARIMSPKAPTREAAEQLVMLVKRWNEELQASPMEFIPGPTFVGTIHELLTMAVDA